MRGAQYCFSSPVDKSPSLTPMSSGLRLVHPLLGVLYHPGAMGEEAVEGGRGI